jgi:hypothetical protein
MATKVRMMKLLQEIKGLAQLSSRRPVPKASGLFLLQMRQHMASATHPRRKLVIPVDLQNLPDIPNPVKITHVNKDIGAADEGSLSQSLSPALGCKNPAPI